MKIIQTLWTKPGTKSGWPYELYHFISWTLSCLQLKKYYNEVELYTDSLGKYLLIDTLKLPYDKVHVVLDDFDCPENLWAIAKVFVYGLQKDPFLHVDGDVFINGKIVDDITARSAGLIYQNKEIEKDTCAFYTNIYHDVLSSEDVSNPLPDWIKKLKTNNIEALNAGVLGGNDIDFFQLHNKITFEFLKKYDYLLTKMKRPGTLNHLLEQVLSRFLVDEMKIKHQNVLEHAYFKNNESRNLDFTVLDHFGIAESGKKFIHMLGPIKYDLNVCKMMERKVRFDYPEYYFKVLQSFSTTAKMLPPTRKLLETETDNRLKIEHFFNNKASSIQQKLNKIPVDKVFFRTYGLYFFYFKSRLPCYNSVSDFCKNFDELLIHSCKDDNNKERLLDVFSFELNKFKYAKSFKTDQLYDIMDNESVELTKEIYSLEQDNIDDFSIGLNKSVGLIYSKWDWTLEDHDKLRKTLEQPPKNCQTALFISLSITKVNELSLSRLAQITLYYFSRHKKFSTGFKNILSFIGKSQTPELRTNIFNCVCFLLSCNILSVRKTNAKTPTIYKRTPSAMAGI